jgi:hypothetical protein
MTGDDPSPGSHDLGNDVDHTPLALFAMPFGLASLRGVWRLMSSSYGRSPTLWDASSITPACARTVPAGGR